MDRVFDWFLSFGEYAGEPLTQRARRQIIVAAAWLSIPTTMTAIILAAAHGQRWLVASNAVEKVCTIAALLSLNRFPHRFALVTNMMFIVVYVLSMGAATVMLGGLYPSGLAPAWALVLALGALLALGRRAAAWWFGAFVAAVVLSVILPHRIAPLYAPDDPTPSAVFTLVAMGTMVFAVMLYFVRQRDRFQQESDDLLHNILPDEVAAQLKASSSMIAEGYNAVSVLFADIVGFTQMSGGMTADELVTLLNEVFSVFDGIAEELGVEKIKTIGDAYMVASGLPTRRSDHATVLAEMALRMRSVLDQQRFGGRRIRMRIGINSGPVVAGIIGTHKFAYDLWGDTVNTASRMESGGIEGAIQISEATYELIADEFACASHGPIDVKGKGLMMTHVLVDRRD